VLEVTPIPLDRLSQLAFSCRDGSYRCRLVGQSSRWTSKSAMKREELRWSFPPKRRISSRLDGRLSVTGPDRMSASKDGTICLIFVLSEM
jgi:hypothetical protein